MTRHFSSRTGLQVCPSLSCPTPSGFFAHPSDCGTYVTCSDGDVDIKQCPEGLHFNPVQRRCDYPKLVQCNITARLLESGCSLKVIVPRTRMQEDVVDSSVACDCECCFKPHDVCTKYYECDEKDGEALVRECSEGLVFNPDIENCDFPGNYQCPTTAPPLCQCGECRYPVEGECNAFYDSSQFPCVDCSGGQQYFPHPTNCRMFIQCAPYGPQPMPCGNDTIWDQRLLTCNHEDITPCCTEWVHCDHNIPYVKDCPAGLHFNAQLKVCDWPASAGCTSGPDHNCELPTPIPTIPEPNATVPTPSPLCDCECCHKPAEDCTAFYYCDEHQSQSYHECSDGLVFHPDLSTCVYANMYPECVVTEPPPVCLCNCFYPSEICTSFYHCDDGTPVMLDCPGGLYWNQDMKSCDLPELVNCTMPVRRRLH
ncbi:Peritrophin-1 [Chionoecetes opilio]|uniref:Peritrophin-1 n=1 Tax=Chionoecetes opilio TaxID=41210 RepID=A0A8J8WDQ2_CHIOP|nr:Peritrophin-1 [Chionoecetes opilio]